MIQPNPKKKIVKKKTNNPYEGQRDAFGNPVYGEGTNRPFTRRERSKMPRVGSMGSGKNGKTIKKAENGDTLKLKGISKERMKEMRKIPKNTSVKKIIEKDRTKDINKKFSMKAGGKMTKCKYGCK